MERRRCSRRALIGGSIRYAGAIVLARVTPPTEERLDPFAAPSAYPYWRTRFLEPTFLRGETSYWWQRFRDSGRIRDAERALLLTYAWWRAETLPTQRMEAIRVGLRISKRLMQHPSVVGPSWRAVFWGCWTLQVGVLKALKRSPEIRRLLHLAMERDPSYFYGLPHFVLGKLYTKLPPFPMAFGDLSVGETHLRAAEPYAGKRYAIWYLFLAENLYLQQRHDEMDAALRDIETVRPENLYSVYNLESTRADALEFRRVLREGSYDKYTWDPVLRPLELLSKNDALGRQP